MSSQSLTRNYKLKEAGSINADSIYLSNISSVCLLTKEEEHSFFLSLREAEIKLINNLVQKTDMSVLLKLKDLTREFERDDLSKEIDDFISKKVKSLSKELFKFILLKSSGRNWFNDLYEDMINRNGIDKRQITNLKSQRRSILELKNKFISSNLRLVLMFANRYSKQTRFQKISDMIQEGNLGLMKAVDLFDVDRGLKFSTYAVWWIRQSILRSNDDAERIIRVPVNQLDLQRKMAKTERKFNAQFGRPPDRQEMLENVKESAKRIDEAVNFRDAIIVRIDNTVGEDSDESFHEILKDDDIEPIDIKIINDEFNEQLKVILTYLTPQESYIVRMRYGINSNQVMTLAEIGKLMNLSRERIRQIESIALKKLKNRLSKVEFFNLQKQNISLVQ